jgi:hypothetical protein
MNANVGVNDARVRWILAVACFAVAIVWNASPVLALLGALLALLLAGTALTHACPVYRLFHISTAAHPHIPAPRS